MAFNTSLFRLCLSSVKLSLLIDRRTTTGNIFQIGTTIFKRILRNENTRAFHILVSQEVNYGKVSGEKHAFSKVVELQSASLLQIFSLWNPYLLVTLFTRCSIKYEVKIL